MSGDGAVGNDRRPDTWPQRRHARSERAQHLAADDDVIGAPFEGDVDNDGIAMFQRGGHRATPATLGTSSSAAAAPQSRSCNASMHSSTIRSCATSREKMVRSAY